jgi:hypothetical protein
MTHPTHRHSITVHYIEGRPLVIDNDDGQWYEIESLAAWLLERCDGDTTVKELFRAARAELNAETTLEQVWVAMDELHRAGFLVRRVPPPFALAPQAQRMVRALGAIHG